MSEDAIYATKVMGLLVVFCLIMAALVKTGVIP